MWRFLLPCICLLAFYHSSAVAEVDGKTTPANMIEFSHGRGLYNNPFSTVTFFSVECGHLLQSRR